MDHYTEPTAQGSTPGDKQFFNFFRTIALVLAYRRQELKRDRHNRSEVEVEREVGSADVQ